MRKLWKRIKAWLVKKLGGVDKATYASVVDEHLRMRNKVTNLSQKLYDAERHIGDLTEQLSHCNPTKIIECREVHANIMPVKCVKNIPFALYADGNQNVMEDMRKNVARDIGLYLMELGLIDFKTRAADDLILREPMMQVRGVVYVKKNK